MSARRAGAPWKGWEDFQLAKAHQDRLPLRILSEFHGRSLHAYDIRLSQLGLRPQQGIHEFYDWTAVNRYFAGIYASINPGRVVLPTLRSNGRRLGKHRIRIK